MHRDFFSDSDIFDSCTPFKYFDEFDDSGFNPFENDDPPDGESGIDDLLEQGYAPVRVFAVLQKDDHWMVLRQASPTALPTWVRVQRDGDR